jgi:hypothetical protein
VPPTAFASQTTVPAQQRGRGDDPMRSYVTRQESGERDKDLWGSITLLTVLTWAYAAGLYSLIRPPRILFRVIRWVGNAMTFGSSSGARRSKARWGLPAL